MPLQRFRRISTLVFLLAAGFCGLSAQVGTASETRLVMLEHADQLNFDKEETGDAQVLTGNVRFRHLGAKMSCDRALYYPSDNSFDAYGNVQMEQGDTLFVTGNILHYFGNERLARLKGNARIINRESVLESDSIDYDRQNSTGYYYTGGKLYDKENQLTSIYGEYNTETKMAVFRENVRLLGKQGALATNDLKYSTASKIAYIQGPSVIQQEGETAIRCEGGWYDTKRRSAQLSSHVRIDRKDGKRLRADLVDYDRTTGESYARGHVEMWDTVQKVGLRSHFAYIRDGNPLNSDPTKILLPPTGPARGWGEGDFALAYDSAVAMEYSGGDTLYFHADTLRAVQDDRDTTLRRVWGIGNVRFFRKDLQGKCDSVRASSGDSIIHMYVAPVIWSDSLQLAGEEMSLKMNSEMRPEILWVNGWVCGVMQEDSIRFNQVEGRKMTGYMENGELRKAIVEGNAQTIYQAKERDGSMVGINKAESSLLTFHLKDKKLDRIVLSPASSGTLYPEDQMPEDEKHLKRFSWEEEVRPVDQYDLFRRNPIIQPVLRRKKMQR
ncbi:MAG: hypothetical protein J6Y79_05385 [Paludibacteraceae bacterium]|nr:hypothetical protein [Paludibacteraceae bacterium]